MAHGYNLAHLFTAETVQTKSIARSRLSSALRAVEEKFSCSSYGFIFPAFAPWKDEIDWALAAFKEMGIDLAVYDREIGILVFLFIRNCREEKQNTLLGFYKLLKRVKNYFLWDDNTIYVYRYIYWCIDILN